MTQFIAKLGTTGGYHVPNYLLDSTTGNVPHPLQAGNIYGPVAFGANGIFQPVAPPQNIAAQHAISPPNGAGYSRFLDPAM
jgi:hypothetical protein